MALLPFLYNSHAYYNHHYYLSPICYSQEGSWLHYAQRLVRLLLVQTEHPMDQLVLLRVLHHPTSLQSQIAHDP